MGDCPMRRQSSQAPFKQRFNPMSGEAREASHHVGSNALFLRLTLGTELPTRQGDVSAQLP